VNALSLDDRQAALERLVAEQVIRRQAEVVYLGVTTAQVRVTYTLSVTDQGELLTRPEPLSP
jgi:hypothetical protein